MVSIWHETGSSEHTQSIIHIQVKMIFWLAAGHTIDVVTPVNRSIPQRGKPIVISSSLSLSLFHYFSISLCRAVFFLCHNNVRK